VKNVVDVHSAWKALEELRTRCEMQRRSEKPDRVPVTPLIDTWYWLPRIGETYDRNLVAPLFGGKAVLSGNINPMNIESGNGESIMQECRDALEYFALPGGFFLEDGDNIPPIAPVESINCLHEAAVKYGRY
jgi:hypothetical protein